MDTGQAGRKFSKRAPANGAGEASQISIIGMKQNTVTPNCVEVSIKGRRVKVPSVVMGNMTLIISGRWLKVASVKDEAWLEGEVLNSPEDCIAKIRQEGMKADLFTFAQKVPDVQPKHNYLFEWDNVAAIPITDYSHWWEQRVSQETRKNVRRAGRRGVIIREVPFSDQLVAGIVEINNESPLRQGRLFWHYGKSFEVVKKDYATLLDRSEFIGAYFEDQLIGFMKLVYMGEIASILQVFCMNKHSDKRTANLLIAKAVEVCAAKGLKFLLYGKYIYGNNASSPLTEFKRRNGFEKILVPRYYVPLTAMGSLAILLKLHLGFKRLLPQRLQDFASKIRSKWYETTLSNKIHAPESH